MTDNHDNQCERTGDDFSDCLCCCGERREIERLTRELADAHRVIQACERRAEKAKDENKRLRSELESARSAIVSVARGKDTKIEQLRGAIKQLKTSAYLDDWETFDKVIREALGDDPV